MAYEDLIKDTSQSFEDGNYFIVTITDLDVNQPYPVQFRWKNKDGTFSIWGAARTLSTPGESDPATPRLQSANVVGGAGFLTVTWDGKNSSGVDLTNIDRVDIYIDGPPFDGTKPTDNFKTAGTKTFTAPAGIYTVILVAVSKLGTLSPTSTAITKTVTTIGTPVTTPEDPSAPTITTGLASIVVSWNGKKSDGNNFTAGAFAGAKVYIGTTSTFTPSANNWVHSLNFANGTNQVSIGVGTVIDKSNGSTLQYGTPYYIKLRTVNADNTETSTAIASSPTNVTVDKLPASEIKTGVLAADASITAGASSGARVVMSGAASPFIIYGTDGSTKLLEFIGGSTGTLAITGSSTFSGNLSVGSGNSIFKAEPATGMWLGNATESSAPFSVSNNGVIRATSGTIGGWYLGSSTLQNASSSPTIRLNTSGIIVGATSSSYIDIAADGITHRNSNGTASGKFTLTTGASPSLTVNGSITASTFSLSGSNGDSWSSGGAFQFGGSSGIKYSGSGNLTIGSSGNTVTIDTSTGAVTVANITASQFSINTNNFWNSTGFEVGNGTNKLKYVSSTGVLEINGQISRDLNNYWNSTGFEVGNGTNRLKFVSSTGALSITGGFTTATSGARIEIPANSGSINIYTSDSTLSPGNINTLGITIDGSSLNWLALLSPTKSGNGQSNIYMGSDTLSRSYIVSNATNWTHQGGTFKVPDGITTLYALNTSFIDIAGLGKWIQMSTGGTVRTFLSTNGPIYANYLNQTTDAAGASTGGTTGTTIVQNSAGYLKVSGSSRRLKEDISTISQTGYLSAMLKIEPVNFRYINPNFEEPLISGLIAEDLDLIPEFKGVVNYDEGGLPLSIAYDRMSALLVLVIKELKQEFDEVKSRLDALEG
jgi:hypothetical protein